MLATERAPSGVRTRRRRAVRVHARASSCRCIFTTPTASRPSAAIRSRRSAPATAARCNASRWRCPTSMAARRPICSATSRKATDIDGSGPYGRFCLMEADANRRYLLVATGTGVTPYRAMLPQLEKLMATRGVEVALIYGARNESELLYGDEFEAFARENPNFHFYACLSAATPRAQPRAHDRNGHVQVALRKSSRMRKRTSPICAAIRRWSTRRSLCSRTPACRFRISAARSTFRRADRRLSDFLPR